MTQNVFVKAGDGGAGALSFRREKYVPRGGPDGGNGGRGGNIILEVSNDLNSLADFRYKHHFVAPAGGRGGGSRRHGKDGRDLVLKVPPGTLVKDDEGSTLADLIAPKQRLVAAAGGRGGRGNANFKSATRQTPRFAELGEPGKSRWLTLELKLIADVGLLGLPNAGKSTLLAASSAARPKIADYPFTTLEPVLGVVELDPETTFVMADLPGLIEGASEGAGLGLQFLRHIERTRVLIHVVDGTAGDREKLWSEQLAEPLPALKVYRGPATAEPFTIVSQEGGFTVSGSQLERLLAMTDLRNPEALARFQRTLDRWGLNEALARHGARGGETVRIRDVEFLYDPSR